MQTRLITLFLALLALLPVRADEAWRQWVPDRLGHGLEMRYVRQGKDYSGHVRSTIIRRLCAEPTRRGILYVHGYNDYFFQTELAEQANSHGYDFYAVDLRKYGRSIDPEQPGQRRFDCREMGEYFPDIDSALMVMHRAGLSEIAIMGHSTGGLLTSLYMARRANPVKVGALVLNSPFLDWNLGKLEWVLPAVSATGYLLPAIPVPQGHSRAYAESLLKQYHGEWSYDTSLKLVESPPVTAGWIRAIDRAQKELRRTDNPIHVPILLMYSARTHEAGPEWDPECSDADVVLDVADIKRYGLIIGTDVTCVKVNGGLHDLLLSRPGLRKPLYEEIFSWLASHLREPSAAAVR